MAFKSTILLCALAAASLAPAADNAPGMLAAGRVDDAINTLQGEIRSSPQDAKLENLLCRAYFSLEDWDRGIAACEQAVSLDPNNATYHMWLGRIYGEKADASSFLSAAGLAKVERRSRDPFAPRRFSQTSRSELVRRGVGAVVVGARGR